MKKERKEEREKLLLLDESDKRHAAELQMFCGLAQGR